MDKPPEYLNVIVKRTHIEAIIVAFIELESRARLSHPPLAYVYAKFASQLLLDFHKKGLCPHDGTEKCHLQEMLSELTVRYGKYINQEFEKLIQIQ